MPTEGNAGSSGDGSNNSGGANQDDKGGANSGAGSGQTGGFVAALNEENRAYADKKGWKDDPNVILKSYRDLESMHSRVKSAIGQGNAEGAPQVPASPSEYDFKPPESVGQDGFYDQKFADTFRGWAHKAKLTGDQAKALHDAYTSQMAQLFQTGQADSAKKLGDMVTKTHDDLVKEWGQPESPGFKRAMEMGRRAIANLEPGLKDALTAFGVIAKDAKGQEVVMSSVILKAFSKTGSRLFAEDNLFGAPAQGDNPFDPAKSNPMKAGEIIKKNPELARTLIAAAGPQAQADWGWWLKKAA